MKPVGPIDARDEYAALHDELLALLEDLEPAAWRRPTACAGWTVRDVAAHLLDTDLRRLSFQRDGMRPEETPAIGSYDDLLAVLNRLNATWVEAARRLSPRLLIELLAFAGPRVTALFRSIDPAAPAAFAVSWAGEESSAHWFDVARELTEKWLHQQQIREAAGRPLLVERRFLHPVLDTFLRALPHVYRDVRAEDGTTVETRIGGEAGGRWSLRRDGGGWRLYHGAAPSPAAVVGLDQDVAWRLLSSRRRPPELVERVRFEGDRGLGGVLLGTVSVMA